MALIFAVPEPTLLASPKFAEVLPTVATVVLSELQRDVLLMSWVEPSLKVPVAVNNFCAPIGSVMDAGTNETEAMVALLTLNGTVVL